MPSEQDPHFVDIFPPARSFALAVRMSRVRWAPLCLADQESWQILSVWRTTLLYIHNCTMFLFPLDGGNMMNQYDADVPV